MGNRSKVTDQSHVSMLLFQSHLDVCPHYRPPMAVRGTAPRPDKEATVAPKQGSTFPDKHTRSLCTRTLTPAGNAFVANKYSKRRSASVLILSAGVLADFLGASVKRRALFSRICWREIKTCTWLVSPQRQRLLTLS